MDHLEQLVAYHDVRRRVSALVLARVHRLDAQVPACPAWSAHQLLAHLVGLAHDLADGNLDGWATARWTAGQVERFGTDDVETLVRSWAGLEPRLADLPPFGSVPAAAFAFGDAVVHEADLLGALEPGAHVPEQPVAMAIAAGVGRWRAVLAATDLPSLHLVVPGLRDWWLGDRADPAAVRVGADRYEVFRALYGRRSRDQVAAWSWSSEPDPYLDAGLAFPFTWAAQALDG